MSHATDILWYIDKQQKALDLQTVYGEAQSDFEREAISNDQDNLIKVLNKRLKGKVTLHMQKKIIDKMIIKKLY